MIHRARVFLIELGKMSPFIICFIVFISYAECLYALSIEDYVWYDNAIVLNKPISWMLGQYFEYNLTTVVILLVISVAVETCIWNKISILYLFAQLGEKEYFSTIELYPEQVAAIITINLLACGWLCWKGIKISLR